MVIKPIETEYKGYLFRSRLEARWAVFFDELEIDWRYEPEGFEFGNGERYLPDFYFPRFDLYVEIKPQWPNESYLEKLRAFHDAGKSIALMIGLPGEYPLYLFLFQVDSSGGGAIEVQGNFIEKDYKICIEVQRSREGRYFSDVSMQNPVERIIRAHHYDFRSIAQAVIKAKQARFERGQSP